MDKLVPIIPIRDGIIFPNTDSVLTFGRPKSLAALESSFQHERVVCFVLQRNARVNDPSTEDLFEIGTLSQIQRMIRTNGEINAQVRGLSRVKIISYEEHDSYLMARVVEMPDVLDDSPEIKALCNHITNEFRKAMNLGKSADFLVFMNIMSDNNPSELADLVASVLEIKPQERQALLETTNVKERLEKIADLLSKEIKILELERRIASKTQERFEKGAREAILREDHFGLSKAKERIIEYLAVRKLAGKMKGPILCFVGPPGVGKTSIGKSIARALGRKFVKVSLGGIRDEAEIRGHRRTYVGALPGRIIQGIKDAGTRNPVFMLDEIDKVGADFRGDPSSALLEALDPEQNNMFSDHYLEVPFDLSDVMFVTTANVLDTIPPALRDRLEIITFAGYTQDEKFKIAKNFLFKKLRETNGLKEDQIEISDEALKFVIHHYTREAGVRNLERRLASIYRKVAKLVAEGKTEKTIVKPKEVAKFLGPIKYSATLIEKQDETGMSTGLAWTEAGGDILFIEVALMPGKGHLTLTGQLGDVMKESAQAALSYIRSRAGTLGISDKIFQKTDIHVQVPEGAVTIVDTSAGHDITTAIVTPSPTH